MTSNLFLFASGVGPSHIELSSRRPLVHAPPHPCCVSWPTLDALDVKTIEYRAFMFKYCSSACFIGRIEFFDGAATTAAFTRRLLLSLRVRETATMDAGVVPCLFWFLWCPKKASSNSRVSTCQNHHRQHQHISTSGSNPPHCAEPRWFPTVL